MALSMETNLANKTFHTFLIEEINEVKETELDNELNSLAMELRILSMSVDGLAIRRLNADFKKIDNLFIKLDYLDFKSKNILLEQIMEKIENLRAKITALETIY